MIKTKIIFLDIDGVLNSHRSMYAWCNTNLDPVAIDLLEALIKETGAIVVISSTWRGQGCDKWRQEIIDDIPMLHEHLHDDWYTPWISVCKRGVEIQEWLDVHDEVIYVIIDDDDDESHPPNQMTNFIKVIPEYGLSHFDYEKALKILGAKEAK